MKDYDKVYSLLREYHTVHAKPRLTAEFNHNRYSGPVPENTPLHEDTLQDPDLYSITSIVEGLRPDTGIAKARVGAFQVSTGYELEPDAARFYVASADDSYKYWTSPEPTDGLDFPDWVTGTYPTKVNPHVSYTKLCNTNKIVIGFEISSGKPTDYEVYVQEGVGGPWVKILDSITDSLVIDTDGKLELWYDGTGWTQTRNFTEITTLAGVQLRVASMDTVDSFLSVLEMGLRLEQDFTPWLQETSDTFDLGDPDALAPIGRASSNTAEVKLFNVPVSPTDMSQGFLFNTENIDSPYYGILQENVKFTLEYLYDCSPVGGSSQTPIRQFTMYADGPWSAGATESASVDLRDSSKYLQEIKAPAVFYENKTVSGIVYRLLDSVGFDRYDINKVRKQFKSGLWEDIEVTSTGQTIPYFWTDPTDNIWDILNSLSEGTQTAFFFDAYDRLQIRTREQAFSELDGLMWVARGNATGTELADIVELEPQQTVDSNVITVSYQTTEFEKFGSGIRKNTVVWQPEDEIINLRSADIAKDLLIGGTEIWFSPADSALWPFEGKMLIESEMIGYKGKEYLWFETAEQAVGTAVWLESYEDYEKYYYTLSPASARWKNSFSGRIKITDRGLWNTPEQNHIVDTTSQYTQKNVKVLTPFTDVVGYYKKKRPKPKKPSLKGKSKKQKAALLRTYKKRMASYIYLKKMYEKYKNYAFSDGITELGDKGCVNLQSAALADNHWLMLVRGSTSDQGMKHYGTRVRFNKGSAFTTQVAGLMMQSVNSTSELGYYLEVTPTAGLTSTELKTRKEISFGRKNSLGNIVERTNSRQVILYDKWYSIDVIITGTTTQQIAVYLDGRRVLSTTRTGGQVPAYTGRFGVFTRGKTNADFEYLYAIGTDPADDQPDYANPNWSSTEWPENFSYWDRFVNSFSSAKFAKYFAFETGTYKRIRRNKSAVYMTGKYNQFYFDEFGPIAHEVREYDVKFANSLPVIAPSLYFSNTGFVDAKDFRATSFGAHMVMANLSRDDVTLYGGDEVQHEFSINGQQLIQRDAQEVKSTDEVSVAASGKKELTVESPWIQTKGSAQSLSDWIENHWSAASDTVRVTIFGNPLIEVGDVVDIGYTYANMFVGENKYFVLSTDNSFADGGLETSLTLRRARSLT